MSMLILTRGPMSGKRPVLTAKADPMEEREGSGVRIPGSLRLISQEYCLSSTTPLRRYGVSLSVQLESGNKAHIDCARLGLADPLDLFGRDRGIKLIHSIRPPVSSGISSMKLSHLVPDLFTSKHRPEAS